MKLKKTSFGPFLNLPLNLEFTHQITIESKGKLTLDTEVVEDGRYWIILYTEAKEEFLKVLVKEKGQKVEYLSISGITLLFTHWKESAGEIKQCELTKDKK